LRRKRIFRHACPPLEGITQISRLPASGGDKSFEPLKSKPPGVILKAQLYGAGFDFSGGQSAMRRRQNIHEVCVA
jgi:hypothetical protein